MERVNVLIAGGGVIGSAMAFWLACGAPENAKGGDLAALISCWAKASPDARQGIMSIVRGPAPAGGMGGGAIGGTPIGFDQATVDRLAAGANARGISVAAAFREAMDQWLAANPPMQKDAAHKKKA